MIMGDSPHNVHKSNFPAFYVHFCSVIRGGKGVSQLPFCVEIVPESLDFTLNLILLLNYPLMVQKGETKFSILTNCS